jgi:hypothetical protein
LSISPEQVLDDSDPGDDVAARFQYQHCYAAIHALKIAIAPPTVDEVVCENHEDFLVRYLDGTLVAVQVKTRDVDQASFKATDQQLKKALAKFSSLDAKFPGAFNCFEFLTNHSFWQEAQSENNLPFLLTSLQSRGKVKGLRNDSPLRMWVTDIATLAGVSEDHVVSALLKCKLTQRKSTIESATKDVWGAISECPHLGQLSLERTKVLANDLIGLARAASTRTDGNSILALYSAGTTFSDVLTDQRLQAKRIRKADVDALISNASSIHVEVLSHETTASFGWGSANLSNMYKKLEKGQLESLRAVQLGDLVRSIEAMYFRWANRYGADVANARINDLRKLAQFDCTEAYVQAQKEGEPFASRMYTALHALCRARCIENAASVYHCRPEHLMGAAGVLTDECIVWWSAKFDLNEHST